MGLRQGKLFEVGEVEKDLLSTIDDHQTDLNVQLKKRKSISLVLLLKERLPVSSTYKEHKWELQLPQLNSLLTAFRNYLDGHYLRTTVCRKRK